MKTILITGASTGIGRATAQLFQQAGWNVAATMRDPTREIELTALPNVLVQALDVTDKDSIVAAVSATVSRFGQLDALLNNAGYGLFGPLEAVTPQQLERQYRTNVFGPVQTIQAALPHLRATHGVIINVSSIGGRVSFPFNSLYHGTKFALEGISESLAMELAPQGVRVKVVEPGGVKTDFAGRSLDVMSLSGLDLYDAPLKSTMAVFADPARRDNHSQPEDIARVILAAATDSGPRLRYLAGKDAIAAAALRAGTSDEDHLAQSLLRFGLQD
jgi:NAD(P)-dependent dehydrogenase (short-subunit alcohol dehydrogenase family)